MRWFIALLLVFVLIIAPFLTKSLSVEADYVPQSSGTLNLSSEFGVSWAGDDVAYAMTSIEGEDSMMLVGYTTSFGAGGSDVWVVKVTNTLNFLDGEPWCYRDMVDWRKTYGGAHDDGGKSVVKTRDGGYIIAGYTESYGAGGSDMYLINVDSDGNLLWDKTYGGSQADGANCIVQAGDNGYLIAGYTNSGVTSQSSWLVKTDSSGQIQFNQTLSGLEAKSIVRTKDGGYVLATRCFAGFGLVKLDSSCQVEWNQTYAASNNSAVESAIQTSVGGYAIAGWENSSETSTSTRLIKTDPYGNIQWQKTYAGLGAYALIQTSSGGYALTGDRAFLMITDSSGNVQWNRNHDALSGDNLHFTRNYYVAEINSTQFVMAGTQQSYGQILTGLDGRMIRVTLRCVEDTMPPKITVLSPENKIYMTEDVPLIFTTNKPIVWVAYRIDNGLNVTIFGNITITLPDGWHSITLYAADADYNNGASETVHFSKFAVDTVPLNIKVHSIRNTTYTTRDLPLTFTVDKPVSWVAYSLDEHTNVTISKNTTLTGIPKGAHTLSVYAQDTIGLIEASNSVSFVVDDAPDDFHPEQADEDESAMSIAESFPTEFAIIASAVFVSDIGVFLLVYFKKRQKQ